MKKLLISTEELVKELKKRNGVRELIAEPYETYKISIGVKEELEIGAAIILVIID